MMDSDGENIIGDPLTVTDQSSEKLIEESCYAPLLADRWLRSEVMSVVFTVSTLRYPHKPALNEGHDTLRRAVVLLLFLYRYYVRS
jgi:hypothetical protein